MYTIVQDLDKVYEQEKGHLTDFFGQRSTLLSILQLGQELKPFKRLDIDGTFYMLVMRKRVR